MYGGTFDFVSVLPARVIQEVVRGQYERRKDGNRLKVCEGSLRRIRWERG